MKLLSWRRPVAALFLGLAACLAAAAAHADPPYRVARLSYESGSVAFSPAGEDDWSRAIVNRPLVSGDRLWVDAGSRAELQIDGGALRVGDQTSVTLLNVDDRIVQAQLTQGELEIRVWRLYAGQSVEIDTPNLAVVIRRPGAWRVDVDEKYGSTLVTVREGDATLYGEDNAFRVTPGETWEFYDTALRDHDSYSPASPDDLERFAMSRDRRWRESVSARHVSREVIGFEELDDYGSWRQVPDYGWAWFPSPVDTGWTPYREGHWAWIEPWGWTWIDDEPWGFAPSHYGRWAFVDSRWCWVPGPMHVRPVYAPALVAFIGGGGLSVSIGIGDGAVGWFPLAPREVYRPAYAASREYFTRVNVSNTVVNVTQVTNVYRKRNGANVRYVNERVPGAVIAVPATTLTQARPVARDAVRVKAQNMSPQAVMPAPPVAPARQSVLGPEPAARKPPEHVFRKEVVAQTLPPPAPAPIESRLPALRSHPGQPAAPSSAPARAAAPAALAPAVRVVPPAQPAATPPPPRLTPANRPDRDRRRPPPSGAPAPSPAAHVPAPARAPAPAPARAPAPAPARAPAPAPASVIPAPAPLQPREERRDERREERQRHAVPPAASPTPIQRQAAPAAPALRPPESPPPRPPETVTPPQQQQQRREERREDARPANPRAEQRRVAASEARQEREQRREERRP